MYPAWLALQEEDSTAPGQGWFTSELKEGGFAVEQGDEAFFAQGDDERGPGFFADVGEALEELGMGGVAGGDAADVDGVMGFVGLFVGGMGVDLEVLEAVGVGESAGDVGEEGQEGGVG